MLAFSAIQQVRIPTRTLHADTTTVSFYGEYDVDTLALSEEEQAELLEIERGYHKKGRPECKQMVVGQIVNEDGIPVVERTMAGSTSDPEWNAMAVEYLQQLQSKGFQYGIFVADSKLVTHNLVTSMNTPEKKITFVSRCPANFERKLAERTIKKAYKNGKWEEAGAFHEGKEAGRYRLQSFSGEVCMGRVRLLVLESSHLKKKAEASLEKERKCLEEAAKALGKKYSAVRLTWKRK